MSERHWYLFAYDIRDHRRWRQAYKLLRGTGDHLQYSVFRCYLSATQMESLRWELERELAEEDDLMIIRLAPQSTVIERKTGKPSRWNEPGPRFEVF